MKVKAKKILGYVMLDPACNLLKSKKDLKALKEETKEADAVLSLACGDGTQTIVKNLKDKASLSSQQYFVYRGSTKSWRI
uniref:Uncharacterized protein n=1 Tax=Clostridioides difficile TaxID=1496 RepID=A0A381I670_CLODI|nr:Uncharacterised protein [Clostridioides difficile]